MASALASGADASVSGSPHAVAVFTAASFLVRCANPEVLVTKLALRSQ
jgi:hypothetical protein